MANEFVIKNGYFSQGNSNITGSLTVSASGTTNDLVIGTNKLFVSASGNVGIGTSTPTQKLTVAGGSILLDNSTALKHKNVGGDELDMVTLNAGNSLFLGSGQRDIYLRAGNNNIVYVTSSAVGIGTTAPTTKLHVSGSENANWVTTIENGSIGGHQLYAGYNNGTTRIGLFITGGGNNINSYDLRVGTSKFIVLGNGNVGIGTITPQSALDINGNTIITGSLTVTAGITGSLFGTASWSINAITASYFLTSSVTSASFAQTASYILNAISASRSVTASYAITASYALNSPGGGGGSTDTSSLLITASFSDPNLVFTKGNGSTFNVDLSGLQTANPIAAYYTLTASVLSGATISLPDGLTYVSSSVYEFLEVHVNGLQLRYNIDYIPMSTSSVKYLLSIPTESELIYKSYKRP